MTPPPDDLPMPPVPARRKRWITVLLSALIFLGGGVVGAGIAAVHLSRQAREALQHPELAPKRIAARLERRLDLDADQAARVEQVVSDHQQRLMDVRGDFLEAAQPEFDALERDIAAVLTPEQSLAFERQVRGLRDEWLPRFDAHRRAKWKDRREEGFAPRRRERDEPPPAEALGAAPSVPEAAAIPAAPAPADDPAPGPDGR